ncbi:MAG: cysteine desulfurase [Chloroflexi bacterium]|nr:cysteine desulfurase [Chloroflexota bacterium]
MGNPIYLDYNATTPVDPRVLEAMLPYLKEHFGNPSSNHAYGGAAHAAVDRARGQVAGLLGCRPGEVVFTGGGSESDNLAIKGVALALRERGRHIVTTEIEHPAVLETCRYLERTLGYRVTYLPVDGLGRVDPAAVSAAITPETSLISVMHANNETGVIQPIAEIAAVARARGVLLHTDAAQSVGKIPTTMDDLGVDLLTVAGHKLYAPKGIGALYVRQGAPLDPVVHGASQEGGLRAGTENVPYMVALGTACELAGEGLERDMPRIRKLRDRLQQRLESAGWALNGHPTQRLPNTLNMSYTGLDGEEVLAHAPDIAASTGSACHAGRTDPSAVLLAMGFSRERALGAVRLSLGRWTTREQVGRAAEELGRAVHALADEGSRAATK